MWQALPKPFPWLFFSCCAISSIEHKFEIYRAAQHQMRNFPTYFPEFSPVLASDEEKIASRCKILLMSFYVPTRLIWKRERTFHFKLRILILYPLRLDLNHKKRWHMRRLKVPPEISFQKKDPKLFFYFPRSPFFVKGYSQTKILDYHHPLEAAKH